jgi:hypothetical protein
MIEAHPSIELNGMRTIRLHRLHLSSSPCSPTFAMSWPHSHRVSHADEKRCEVAPAIIIMYEIDIENDY